eukprot:Skav211959  [mRNA]  locus=scaffold433:52337:53855:- [translate_table: standard]
MAQLVEVDNELFLWSASESEGEDETAALQRKMFNLQYLSRQEWVKSSRTDVPAARLQSGHRRIATEEVLEALRRIPSKHWKNTGRANVRPEGVETIDSITLGLVSCQSTLGRPLPSKATRTYRNLTEFLLRFWKQHIQDERHEGNLPGCQSLVCTSIQMNRNYAAREHVDGNNVGPSWIIALGDWTKGGELFVEDPKGCEKHKLSCDIPGRYREGDVCRGSSLDVHNKWARFDGRCMHFVRPFRGGDRFSLVFFATTRHGRAPEAAKSFLSLLGFPLPQRQVQDAEEVCQCSAVWEELVLRGSLCLRDLRTTQGARDRGQPEIQQFVVIWGRKSWFQMGCFAGPIQLVDQGGSSTEPLQNRADPKHCESVHAWVPNQSTSIR